MFVSSCSKTLSKLKRSWFLQNLYWWEPLTWENSGRTRHVMSLCQPPEWCPASCSQGYVRKVCCQCRHLSDRLTLCSALLPKCRDSICELWNKTWSLKSFVGVDWEGRRGSLMQRRQTPGDRVGRCVERVGVLGWDWPWFDSDSGFALMCCDWALP